MAEGGRRGKIVGLSAAASEAGDGVIFGGNRRIGVTGVRVGRTIRAVSRFSMVGAEPACSGRGGSAIRTVSFFGSAMDDQRALKKIAQTSGCCHLFIWSTAVSPVRRMGVSPVHLVKQTTGGTPVGRTAETAVLLRHPIL